MQYLVPVEAKSHVSLVVVESRHQCLVSLASFDSDLLFGANLEHIYLVMSEDRKLGSKHCFRGRLETIAAVLDER